MDLHNRLLLLFRRYDEISHQGPPDYSPFAWKKSDYVVVALEAIDRLGERVARESDIIGAHGTRSVCDYKSIDIP